MNKHSQKKKDKKHRAWIIIPAVFFMSIVALAGARLRPSAATPSGLSADSSQLQSYLDQQYKTIAEYNELLSWKKEANNNIIEAEKKNKILSDSFQKSVDHACEWIKTKGTQQKNEQIRRTFLDYTNTLYDLKQQQKTSNLLLDSNVNNILKFDQQINNLRPQYNQVLAQLTQLTQSLTGAGVLSVGKKTYRFFIVNRKDHAIQVHNPKGMATIQRVQQQLQKTHAEPLMITNGGMFEPGYAPQGLLVENGQEYASLDTLKPVGNSPGNFYLQPNGVFYTDQTGLAHVVETDSFRHVFAKDKKPQYASQSGPMLIAGNQVNKNFKARSENLNIRSGVGTVDENRTVFIISDNPVNFFDFAILFKDVFGCKNALYLDGAISKMYIADPRSKKKPQIDDGQFGPMISVTTIKKTAP